MVALLIFAVFAFLVFLHQFAIIKRQHQQIVDLETLLALRGGDPAITAHIARKTELLDRQNQAEDHEPRVILRPAT